MVPVKTNQNWLPSIFNDSFDNEWMARANATAPAINVIENEKDYKVELAVPGLTKNDFKVSVDESNNLVICMEKKDEKKEEKKDGKYLRREFSYSRFQQSILLPDNVEKDKISAKVEHGVLFIDIPKVVDKKVQETTKTIDVKYDILMRLYRRHFLLSGNAFSRIFEFQNKYNERI